MQESRTDFETLKNVSIWTLGLLLVAVLAITVFLGFDSCSRESADRHTNRQLHEINLELIKVSSRFDDLDLAVGAAKSAVDTDRRLAEREHNRLANESARETDRITVELTWEIEDAVTILLGTTDAPGSFSLSTPQYEANLMLRECVGQRLAALMGPAATLMAADKQQALYDEFMAEITSGFAQLGLTRTQTVGLAGAFYGCWTLQPTIEPN